MLKEIHDFISGRIICSKNPEKTVKELLDHYNSTFAYRHRGVHYPENAIAIEQGDIIVIRRRK